jgi:signal transduction histidine kinase
MWKSLTLRNRIMLMLGALVCVSVAGGVISVGYTYMMDGFFTTLIDVDVESLVAAQELENALIMQKGYVTYFFTDNDPQWLDQLNKYHNIFEFWLKKVRQYAEGSQERSILNEIEAQYVHYGLSRDKVLALYKAGNSTEGFQLHKKVRDHFFKIIELCDEYEKINQNRIADARQRMRNRIKLVSVITALGLIAAVMIGIFLANVLLNDVLGPIRQLALETKGEKKGRIEGDEVKALSARVLNLMEDVDETKSKLKWSREHLQQAEKWALVGKLAAGVAHSVRNPLTSVKMRLFSMERTLSLTTNQKEDFEVISEEIRHIDTIVGNFLEFSRSPKLKMQKISPSDCVDNAVQLLHHRLESYQVDVQIMRNHKFPEILADPDQLKEVLVNLIVNACEAMVNGGKIQITEKEQVKDNSIMQIILISDNGPGIPEAIQEKLFQPFFSTKEEGTGLGLSIAARIVEEHGGSLDVVSKNGEGATFIISLPRKENVIGNNPHS